MNFNDIIKAVKEQQESNASVVLHNQTEMLTANAGNLQRHEMAPLKVSVCVFPKEIQLPFNPVDPADTHFSSEKKFIAKDAPTEFVKALKAQMANDEKLHTFYAGLIKKTADEYDVSNADELTADDFAIFNQFTVPAQYSANTQKIRTAAAGKFGREVASPLLLDEDNKIVNASEYLIGRLWGLEREVRSEKLAEFDLSNDRSNLTSDQKDQRTTIARSMQISAPRKSGVVLFLEFTGKENNTGFKFDTIDTANIDNHLRYFNCNPDELKKINRRLKKKDDNNLNFVVLQISYSDGIEKNTTIELSLYKSRQYEKIDSETVDELVDFFGTAEDFNRVVNDFMSNGLKGDFDRRVKRSVFKFRPISDPDLATLYKHRMPEIKPYVTEKIYLEYGDTIEYISPTLKSELDALSDANKLKISAKDVIESSDQATDFTDSIESLEKLDMLESPEDVIDAETGENLEDLLK